ncbi:MAG: acyltransferase [Verrucomicrobia bacterium]|nr:acyltransferase [Verrucomicrobiota bacterium]
MLDIFRFTAASLVLLHHIAWRKFGTYIPWNFTQTAIEPVVAFFVLSGFVIALTAETNDRTAGQYLLSRATRLLSVSIPAIILTIVLDHVGSAIFPALYSDHWTDPATIANLNTPLVIQAGTTLTFINQIWSLNLWPGTNSPFWSLGYEAVYYVLFGIAYYERRAWPRLIGIIGVSLVVGPKILLLLPIWLMGVGVWHLYKRTKISPASGTIILAVSFLGYAAFMISQFRGALDHRTEILAAGVPANLVGLSNHFLSNYVSGLFFSGALLGLKGIAATLSPALVACGTTIRTLARCTFSMYLYHYPLAYFFRAIAAVVCGQRGLDMRSWPMTLVVLVGTGLSIYLLALITEQKKNEFRGWLAVIFRLVRPTELA